MKTSYYSGKEIDFKYHNRNTGCFYLQILLLEQFIYGFDPTLNGIFLKDFNNWSSEKLIDNFKKIFKNADGAIKFYADIDELVRLYKITNHLKHKDKNAFATISCYKTMLNKLKSEFLLYRDDLLEYNHIKDLMPFIDDGIWVLEDVDYKLQQNKEHELIKPITDTIVGREYIFSFESDIEELFEFDLLDSNEDSTCDFIKIQMWHLPPLLDMPNIQFKYSRDDLQKALTPFNAQLNKLSEKIFNIPFTTDNARSIKELCKVDLKGHITTVQQCIDESLYLSSLKNQFSLDMGFTFCLGIASAETLINYYERSKSIEPYMASEIKQQVGRHGDLNASYFFSYYTANLPSPTNDNNNKFL